MAQALTGGPQHHFFGFHDLCPWDESGRFLLAVEADFIDRPPIAKDKARICLIDTKKNNEFRVLAETSAWNFHQGARLQWLPGIDGRIIFNDRHNDKFVSVIFNINTGEKETIPAPIYAVSPDGLYALGVNFARLTKYGGYGYALPSTTQHLPSVTDDGIFCVDLKTGIVKLIAPLRHERAIFSHINFNPSGTRICFIEKYRLPDGGFMQKLVTTNTDGSDWYELPGHVSHYCWKNDTEILAYGKHSPRIAALRRKGFFQSPLLKPFLNIARKLRGGLKQRIAGQSYLLLKDKSQEVRRIAVDTITEDGHPMFSPDGNWVITDTYPDKNHERILILYNWNTGERTDIGKFKSLPKELETNTLPDGRVEPWDISEMRSDLHPRWNRDGTRVCIDSVHEGTRQMYVLDVTKHITNDK